MIRFCLYLLVMLLGGVCFGAAAERLGKKKYFWFGMDLMCALMYVALAIKLLLNI